MLKFTIKFLDQVEIKSNCNKITSDRSLCTSRLRGGSSWWRRTTVEDRTWCRKWGRAAPRTSGRRSGCCARRFEWRCRSRSPNAFPSWFLIIIWIETISTTFKNYYFCLVQTNFSKNVWKISFPVIFLKSENTFSSTFRKL